MIYTAIFGNTELPQKEIELPPPVREPEPAAEDDSLFGRLLLTLPSRQWRGIDAEFGPGCAGQRLNTFDWRSLISHCVGYDANKPLYRRDLGPLLLGRLPGDAEYPSDRLERQGL